MVRPRLTIYVCQESQQLRDLQQKHEDGDAVASTFFGTWGGAGTLSAEQPPGDAPSTCRSVSAAALGVNID